MNELSLPTISTSTNIQGHNYKNLHKYFLVRSEVQLTQTRDLNLYSTRSPFCASLSSVLGFMYMHEPCAGDYTVRCHKMVIHGSPYIGGIMYIKGFVHTSFNGASPNDSST